MSRKRLPISLASVAALAASSLTPAVAQATPQFRINGVLAGANKQNVVQFGTITMKSPFWGEIKCNLLVGAPVGNESEKGVAPVDGWETWSCHMPECLRGSAFATSEPPPRLVEPEPGHITPERAEVLPPIPPNRPGLPWPAELTAPEGRISLRIGNTEKGSVAPVKVWIECPGEAFEVPYEGELAPAYVNGSRNGLKPSHLEFEGSGGKTGHLHTPDICGGECTMAELFLSGSLTTLGTMQQLVTAE